MNYTECIQNSTFNTIQLNITNITDYLNRINETTHQIFMNTTNNTSKLKIAINKTDDGKYVLK